MSRRATEWRGWGLSPGAAGLRRGAIRGHSPARTGDFYVALDRAVPQSDARRLRSWTPTRDRAIKMAKWGAWIHPLCEPSWLLYAREGSSFCFTADLNSAALPRRACYRDKRPQRGELTASSALSSQTKDLTSVTR